MNDEAKIQASEPTAVDTVKLVIAIFLLVGGVVGYYWFKSSPDVWKSWVALFGGLLLSILLFAFSRYGSNFGQFFLEARVELRKVFWPSMQETRNTTLIVLVFVIFASAFFWVLDLGLAYLTKFFTSSGT